MKESNIKCEHPVVIFNHDIIYLLSVLKCTAYFRGNSVAPGYASAHESYFPWQRLYAWKSQVTPDTVDDGFVVDADGVHYPLFLVVPCGKCKLCKAKQRDDWETRCMCESAVSKYPPLFITLTFRPSCRPDNMEDVKVEFQKFMKRLRENTARRLKTENRELRFLAVSEWTPNKHYAHIHMLLWNMPFVHFHTGDKSFYQLRNFIQDDCWQLGFVKVLPARDPSGRYVLKYMTKVEDPKADGCWRLASRRKGIGYGFVDKYLRKDFQANPDMLSFRVPDGKGSTVSRPIPTYFRRILCPSLSQLFPARIIRSIKDFRSCAADLRYYYHLSGKDKHLLSLNLMYSDIMDKYHYLHMPWRDAAPSREWQSDIMSYTGFEYSRKNPLRLDFSDPSPDLPFDNPYDRECILYLPPNISPGLEKKLRYTRESLLDKYKLCRELYLQLLDYEFDPADIDSALALKDLRNQAILLLSKDFRKYDIDNEVYLVDQDREWIQTHWMQHDIG